MDAFQLPPPSTGSPRRAAEKRSDTSKLIRRSPIQKDRSLSPRAATHERGSEISSGVASSDQPKGESEYISLTECSSGVAEGSGINVTADGSNSQSSRSENESSSCSSGNFKRKIQFN